MAASKILNMLQFCEEQISKGNSAQALKVFEAAKISEIPRELRARASDLARRLDRPELALKLIWENLFVFNSTSEEDVIAGANAFRRLGANNQAIKLLSSVTESAEREKALGFCYIGDWNYARAIQHLCRALELGASQRDVININLAASYLVEGDHQACLRILNETIPEGLEERNLPLYANGLEIRLQLALETEDFDLASVYIDRSEKLLNVSDCPPFVRLFLSKWKAIYKISVGQLDFSSNVVQEFYTEVRKKGHWHTLRHLDLYRGKIEKDNRLLNHVYFGSPFRGLREQISCFAPIQGSYLWYDLREKDSNVHFLDSYDLKIESLKNGLSIHRLLLVLASDFYSPKTVEKIFDKLFPDEVFTPETSKKRIHQLVATLKKSLDDEGIEVQLDSTANGYRLRPVHLTGFKVYKKMNFETQEDFLHAFLNDRLQEKTFKRQDLERFLPLGKDKWSRAIKKLQDRGLLTKEGKGRGISYKLVSE